MDLENDDTYKRLIRQLARDEQAVNVFDSDAVMRASREMAKRSPKEREKLRKDVAAIWERYEKDVQTV